MNKGRRAARRDPEHDIVRCSVPDRFAAGLFRVLGTFDRLIERLGTTGNTALHLVGVALKSGGALDRVENSQASTGSRAHIEESPPALQSVDDEFDRACDVASLFFEGSGAALLLEVEDPQSILDGQAVEFAAVFARALGGEVHTVVCVIQRNPQAAGNLAAKGLELRSLFAEADLLPV